jgi:beta-lactamase superfamily II metal-dependent hydrolase
VELSIFHAGHGDCLLLESKDHKRMLIDGGVGDAYRHYISKHLTKIHQSGDPLDLVYVSHIDEDHIQGVQYMLDDLVEWRVYEARKGDPGFEAKKPKVPRPPEIRGIWHNSFHEQTKDNQGKIEDLLAADAVALEALGTAEALELGAAVRALVQSKRQAMMVSRRIGEKQLNIPLNEDYDHGLMFVADPPDPIALGTMELSVVGPFADDLDELREEWNEWLETNAGERARRAAERAAERDEERLWGAELQSVGERLLEQAKRLGRRSRVTTPNLASLMLLAEEGDKRVLLTGDGAWQDVLDGLDRCEKLDDDGNLHVDVLKIPHHGSEHNSHPDFCKRIIADHYVFCGNGHSHNPEPDVVDAYVNSRIGTTAQKSKHAKVGDPFKLWFNSSDELTEPGYTFFMEDLEKQVRDLRARSKKQMSYKFLRKGTDKLTIRL